MWPVIDVVNDLATLPGYYPGWFPATVTSVKGQPLTEAPTQSRDTRKDTLQGLADALKVLAKRMQTRVSAAEDFVRLAARAERIAATARLIQTSKWGVVENSASLAKELAAFAQEVATAAARAATETSGNAAIADALLEHSQRLSQAAQGVGSSKSDLATGLRPLEVTLTALHGRMRDENTVPDDAARLARRAAVLASGALSLKLGGRPAEAAAMEVHTALRDFVGQAGSIAIRMSTATSGLRQAAAGMARQTQTLSTCLPNQGVLWQAARC